jgi:hypothetical protein
MDLFSIEPTMKDKKNQELKMNAASGSKEDIVEPEKPVAGISKVQVHVPSLTEEIFDIRSEKKKKRGKPSKVPHVGGPSCWNLEKKNR